MNKLRRLLSVLMIAVLFLSFIPASAAAAYEPEIDGPYHDGHNAEAEAALQDEQAGLGSDTGEYADKPSSEPADVVYGEKPSDDFVDENVVDEQLGEKSGEHEDAYVEAGEESDGEAYGQYADIDEDLAIAPTSAAGGHVLNLSNPDFSDSAVWEYDNYTITYTGPGPLTIGGSNAGNPRRVYVTNAAEIFIGDSTVINGTLADIDYPSDIMSALTVHADATIHGGGRNITIGELYSEGGLRLMGISGLGGNLTIAGEMGDVGGIRSIDGHDITILGNIGDTPFISLTGAGSNLSIYGSVGDIIIPISPPMSPSIAPTSWGISADGSINISGTVGNITAGGIGGRGIISGGNITISGTVGNIRSHGGITAHGDIDISGKIGYIFAGFWLGGGWNKCTCR